MTDYDSWGGPFQLWEGRLAWWGVPLEWWENPPPDPRPRAARRPKRLKASVGRPRDIRSRRRRRPSYREWANAVKLRDGCCVECGSTTGLHAHHTLSKADHPELAFNLDNGETLCSPCHRARHPELPDVLFNKTHA